MILASTVLDAALLGNPCLDNSTFNHTEIIQQHCDKNEIVAELCVSNIPVSVQLVSLNM